MTEGTANSAAKMTAPTNDLRPFANPMDTPDTAGRIRFHRAPEIDEARRPGDAVGLTRMAALKPFYSSLTRSMRAFSWSVATLDVMATGARLGRGVVSVGESAARA